MFTVPFAILPHPDWNNFGQLAKTVIANNSRLLRHKGCTWTTDDIWAVLQASIVESYGVDRDEISREMNFGADLEIE